MDNKPVNDQQAAPQYDPHLVPAETAARQKREGSEFMHTPSQQDDLNQELKGKPADPESLDTTGGYTVDKEGLVNNYAIEPEPYINEPGDLRAQEQEQAAETARERQNLQQDEQGKLTDKGDRRGKGPGII